MSKRPYHTRNKQFAAWIPRPLYLWFLDYLQKYSFGDSTAAQFKMFLYELQKQEEKGITIANPEKEVKEESFLKRYKDAKSKSEVCLRRPSKNGREEWMKLDPATRDRACDICKTRDKSFYRACQDLKKEYEEAQKQ